MHFTSNFFETEYRRDICIGCNTLKKNATQRAYLNTTIYAISKNRIRFPTVRILLVTLFGSHFQTLSRHLVRPGSHPIQVKALVQTFSILDLRGSIFPTNLGKPVPLLVHSGVTYIVSLNFYLRNGRK